MTPLTRKAAAPVGLAGTALGATRHVCAFFHGNDEAYRVLLPFIKEGFARGEKAVHVVNPGEHALHLRRLGSAGIDTVAAEQTGQFELRTNTETYLREGRFAPDRMLQAFEQMASGNAKGAFPLSRIVCHMDWAADGGADVDDLVEFEARVNDVWCRHDDAVVCIYDLARFGGDIVVDMMRTHPMVLIGDTLHRNPFFVPPAQFLLELRQRRLARSKPPATA